MTVGAMELFELRPAPMWRRIAAAILDAAVVFIAFICSADRWGQKLPDGTRGWHGWGAVAVVCLIACYWILPEWLSGYTLGKFFFGLRVTATSGKHASFIQSLKRNLLRPIDFIFFYLVGFLVASFSPFRQRLGDQWAHTVVLVSPALPRPEKAHANR